MKKDIISQINKLIEEYECESEKHSYTSAYISHYYDGKAQGLKEALKLINDIE